MIDKLAEDNDKGAAGPVKSMQASSNQQSSNAASIEVAGADGDAGGAKESAASKGQSNEAKKKAEYNPDFDIEKLQQEKEAEIKGYVETLEAANVQIDELKN